jgi:exodeoxyribonuclease VIII
MGLTSRMTRDEYMAIAALSVTRLKEIGRSPQHYRYCLEHPKTTDALTLGTATHVAVLEPERFERDYAVWERRTDAGAMAPRRGQHWEDFLAGAQGKTILTPDERDTAQTIAAAVRADMTASPYLAAGEPEVTMQWAFEGRACKGRADWLTRRADGMPVLVGLKTARDCRVFAFGNQAAKLEYGMQWAFYFDGYLACTGHEPRMIEIVVESAPPHAVATYIIDKDIILQGRDNYREMIKVLAECEASGEWPGPVVGEQFLTLPSWYYPAMDDIGDLDLEPLR